MAITYPLALPSTPGFNSFVLRRQSVVATTRSPYTGEDYSLSYPGKWWEADVGLPSMKEDDAALWRSFFAKLNGMEGTFLMGDPTRPLPRGAAKTTPGTPLVNGAGQTGNTLAIDGLPTSVTGYLKAADPIQLGSGLSARFYHVLDDVNTNGSGQATLMLWPWITSAPADNAAVVVVNPQGLWRLTDNSTQDAAQPFPFFDTQFSARSVV